MEKKNRIFSWGSAGNFCLLRNDIKSIEDDQFIPIETNIKIQQDNFDIFLGVKHGVIISK